MKLYCNTCTIHFSDEFDKTMEPPCNYWGDMGMANLPAEEKKKIWEWMFFLNVDEIAIKYKIAIQFGISGFAIDPATEFINLIPGYTTMTELEKREAQREYVRNKKRQAEPVGESGGVPDLTPLLDRRKGNKVN